MGRDHFAKIMRDSRYQSRFYENAESNEAMLEKRIKLFFNKIVKRVKKMVGKK